MKNIVDLTLELIAANNDGVTDNEIINAIQNEELLALKDGKKLDTVIYNDLMTDGRFLSISKTGDIADKKWDLKEKYTMREILREQYRSLSETDLKKIVETDSELENDVEEEIEMAVLIDENEFDDAVALNDVQEFDDLESDR